MKLPHQAQPTMRTPADFSAGLPLAGWIRPSLVQPQKTSGQCTCSIGRDDYWRPGHNNCWAGVPQCTGAGVCNCVDRMAQTLNGAAKDTSGFRG
jgi:hypothetical protein